MRIFVSSVIVDFEEYREATVSAVSSLGHEVTRSEDFVASPATSQVACLAGVRDSDAVIVLLGERYGSVQHQANHQPTRSSRKPKIRSLCLFSFNPESILSLDRKPLSTKLGIGRPGGTPRGSVILKACDQLSRLPFTAGRSRARVPRSTLTKWRPALLRLPQRDRHHRSAGPSIFVSIVGSPRQSILRPSKIEDPEFRRELEKRALFDDPSIFDTREGIEPWIEDHSLRLHQTNQSIVLSEEGSLLLSLSLPRSDRVLSALIEEDIIEAISKALRFGAHILDAIDPTERLSHIAVAVGLDNSGGGEWRIRAQHERNQNSMRMMSDRFCASNSFSSGPIKS